MATSPFFHARCSYSSPISNFINNNNKTASQQNPILPSSSSPSSSSNSGLTFPSGIFFLSISIHTFSYFQCILFTDFVAVYFPINSNFNGDFFFFLFHFIILSGSFSVLGMLMDYNNVNPKGFHFANSNIL